MTEAMCPLEARVLWLSRFGYPADGYSWATARHLEGRSAFEALVEVVQPGRGPARSAAHVAAALLIASDKLNRKQACDHCEIPQGGARSRVVVGASRVWRRAWFGTVD